ncbi:hypothetical protein EV121DRAFT_272230 [Schizophyllum commune]
MSRNFTPLSPLDGLPLSFTPLRPSADAASISPPEASNDLRGADVEQMIGNMKLRAREEMIPEMRGSSGAYLFLLARARCQKAKDYEAMGDLWEALRALLHAFTLFLCALDHEDLLEEMKKGGGPLTQDVKKFIENEYKDTKKRCRSIEDRLYIVS